MDDREIGLHAIRAWREDLVVEDVDGNWCYAQSNNELMTANIDWLISELEKSEVSRKKILKSMGCY